uniref:Uncharacterized protein n=1 Tax=Lepeophtheirus salmonis TaxID=72036 RepID=A0A0K2UUH4_LEPSM
MVPEDLVVDVSVEFLVGFEEVGKYLAPIGNHVAEEHDLSWMFGPEGSLNKSSSFSQEAIIVHVQNNAHLSTCAWRESHTLYNLACWTDILIPQ